MATSTEHYNFPKYEATDLPNLLDQYNNFADSADSTIYQQNTNIQSALTNSNTALSKANETAALVGTQTGTGTVFQQLEQLSGGGTDYAPKVHTSNTGSTYGAASTAQYGHVRMASGFGDSGADVAMPISLGASLNSRVAELEEGGGGGGAGGDYAPVNHASSATTYGVGSESQYGHVKLSSNVNTQAGTGVALAQSGGYALNQQIAQLKSQIESLQSQLTANPFVLKPNTVGNASMMGGSGSSGQVTMNAVVSPLAHVITIKAYLSTGFNPGTNRSSDEVVCFTLDRQYRPTAEMMQLLASDQHTTQGQVTNAYIVVSTNGEVKVRFISSQTSAASGFGNDTAIMAFVYGAES